MKAKEVLLNVAQSKPFQAVLVGLAFCGAIYYAGVQYQKGKQSEKNLPKAKDIKPPEGYDVSIYSTLIDEMWSAVGWGYSLWAENKRVIIAKWLKLKDDELKYCYGIYQVRYSLGRNAPDLVIELEDEWTGTDNSQSKIAANALLARLRKIKF